VARAKSRRGDGNPTPGRLSVSTAIESTPDQAEAPGLCPSLGFGLERAETPTAPPFHLATPDLSHPLSSSLRLLDISRSAIYCLRPEVPTGGRLSCFLPEWLRITNDTWVLATIRLGYALEMQEPPPGFRGIRPTITRSGSATLSEEVEGLVMKCAAVHVPPDQGWSGYYNTYFLVPKKDGGIRPILNLKQFNHCLRKARFKMNSLETIISVMDSGLWLASVDLKDAYFHIGIRKEHRKYLRFCWQGKLYEYTVLPFGLSTAPRVFTKILAPVIEWLRRKGVQLYAYLDDILVVGNSHARVLASLTITIQTLTRVGYVINVKKSDLAPTQDLVYVGGRFRTDLGRVFLPTDRKKALIKAVSSFARVGLYHPARRWLQVLGLMAATIATVQFARLNMRPVQWFLRQRWSASMGLTTKLMFPTELLPCCRWWMESSNLSLGREFVPPPHTVVVTTDASNEGWGGHATLETGPDPLFSGIWDPKERHLHINVLELRAIRLTLQLLTPSVAATSVLVECDNTTAVSYLNKQGGTHSEILYKESLLLYTWAQSHQVRLRAIHRPGVDNELADFLSRNRPDPNEWVLSSQVCDRLFRMWSLPQVDLFASHQNHRLPVWFGRYPHPEAAAHDALSQCWTGLSVYAFPPKNLLLRTVVKLRNDGVQEAIVIAPNWPRSPWFPLLQQMALQSYQLPLAMDLLSQTLTDKGTLHHPDLRALSLTAWRLSASA